MYLRITKRTNKDGSVAEYFEKTAGVQVPYERALLAMVANRLCDPESKLGVWDRWLSTVHLPSCQNLKLRHMYEAMDLLHANIDEVEKTVFSIPPICSTWKSI